MTESEIRLECIKQAIIFVNIKNSLNYEREITDNDIMNVANRFFEYIQKGK